MKLGLRHCLLILTMLATSAAWPLGGDFTLTSDDGQPYALHDSRGRAVVLAFGYTFCPDVCPTGLATIGTALRELGPAADDVDTFFVSLDPDRDTPEMLREYTRYFHPRMRALTGSASDLRRVATLYRVRYEFVGKGKVERYTMDHSADLYVIDRRGVLTRMLPHGLPSSALADALRDVLSRPTRGEDDVVGRALSRVVGEPSR